MKQLPQQIKQRTLLMFLKVSLHTISSCLDLLTKTMKQLPQQIKQRTLLMFLKILLHTISSCLDL